MTGRHILAAAGFLLLCCTPVAQAEHPEHPDHPNHPTQHHYLSAPGQVISAPEIDGGTASSGMALLAGALALLYEQRRR